jgi:hypothetical protein
MKLRLANKMMKEPERYSENQLQRACNRYERCWTAKAAKAFWHLMMRQLGPEGSGDKI